MTEEFIEEWDWKTGQPTGKAVARSKAHREGIPHEGVHLWIISIRHGIKHILMQRRAPNKEFYPGYLDISVGGHVVFGQSEGKIEKESNEELGLQITEKDLIDLGYYRYEEFTPEFSLMHREFQHIWILRDDRTLDTYTFNDGEVDAIAEIRFDDFKAIVAGEHSLTSSFCDGKSVKERILTRKDFHPLFFTDSMILYLKNLIARISAL